MNRRDLRPRFRSRRFLALKAKRVAELRAAGVSMSGAQLFAHREMVARTEAALLHPIEEVLAAEVEFTGPIDDPTPNFRLVYSPLR